MTGRIAKSAVVLLATLLLAGLLAYASRHEIVRRAIDLPPFTGQLGRTQVHLVEMPDGVALRTTVFLPEGEGPWPVLLMRNPYTYAFIFPFFCELATFYGYACVNQEVRGVGDSGGEWQPMFNERADGLATLAWLVEQDWQDGNVALVGMSYLAAAQWVIADRLPPEVKTMVPMVFGTNAYAATYENGVFKPDVMTAWAAFMPEGEMELLHGDAYEKMLHHRPAREADEAALGLELDWYRRWLDSPHPDSGFWAERKPRLLRSMPEKTGVPVLMMAGWYDPFLGPQLEDFRRLATREGSKLIIGPWDHLQQDVVEGVEGIDGEDELEVIMDWLGHHLKGEPLDQKVGVVQTFSFGERAWHTRPTFPPAGTATTTLHLAALEASTRCTGGRLVDAPPKEPGSVSYRYDPDDPVPTRGGAKLLSYAFRTFESPDPGIVDQQGLCERPDVLTFETAPLGTPLHLVGSASVELSVSSDARDTAFTAKLIAVTPEGTARNVRDGIVALSSQHSVYEPGTVVTVRIDLWPIEWRFPPGTRLRLDVSSSNFPAFHPHPNVAGPWAEVEQARVATQTIHGGRISLPILGQSR